MPSFIKGIGSFTTDNIVAILRALPETDGTYVQVVALATENGAQLSANTIGKWITNGRTDIQAGKSQTAYARFSQRYDSIMAEHCSPDANRSRELDRAFDILERTCECGNDKMLAPDGQEQNQAQHATTWRSHRPDPAAPAPARRPPVRRDRDDPQTISDRSNRYRHCSP